ncbi:hypothetical protein MMC12_000278 [Toensbergia leucococca]|nr:hypothetical protein [Toensbergia leucococca]
MATIWIISLLVVFAVHSLAFPGSVFHPLKRSLWTRQAAEALTVGITCATGKTEPSDIYNSTEVQNALYFAWAYWSANNATQWQDQYLKTDYPIFFDDGCLAAVKNGQGQFFIPIDALLRPFDPPDGQDILIFSVHPQNLTTVFCAIATNADDPYGQDSASNCEADPKNVCGGYHQCNHS